MAAMSKQGQQSRQRRESQTNDDSHRLFYFPSGFQLQAWAATVFHTTPIHSSVAAQRPQMGSGRGLICQSPESPITTSRTIPTIPSTFHKSHPSSLTRVLCLAELPLSSCGDAPDGRTGSPPNCPFQPHTHSITSCAITTSHGADDSRYPGRCGRLLQPP